MLRRLIRGKLAKVERELGGSLDYVRHILDVSLRAFFAFGKVLPFAEYRKVLPHDAWRVARIVASRDEDCGTCVQIEVNQAKAEGVPVDVVRATLDGRVDDLPGTLPTVYRFAEAVVGHTGAEEELRPKLEEAYGATGVVELAFAIASTRIFPITKRALGYATSCESVTWKV